MTPAAPVPDTLPLAVDNEVASIMVIGGTNGFSAIITAEINAAAKEISIEVTHEGGW